MAARTQRLRAAFAVSALAMAHTATVAGADGEAMPAGTPPPVHTLLAQLQGDYAGLSAAPQDDPRFGEAVALHGDTLVVGAPGTNVDDIVVSAERGAVFVFRRDPASNAWLLHQRFGYPFLGLGVGHCGSSVAVNDHTLLVGCPMRGWGGVVFAYPRAHPDAPFTAPVQFVDDGEQAGARCGASVALIDAAPGTDSPLPMAAVGCPERRDFPEGNLGLVGAVKVYRNFLGDWQPAATLAGPSTVTTGFGRSMSLNRAGPSPGMTLLLAVGIPATGNGHGSVRVYAMGNTVADWTQEHQIAGPAAGSRFGFSVHMRAGRLAVGAPQRTLPNPLTHPPLLPTPTGSLSIATRACTLQGTCSWSATVTEIVAPLLPLPSTQAQNRMGHAVHAPTPARIVAGAPMYPFGSFIGQARHYLLAGGDWTLNDGEPFVPVGPAPATAQFGAALAGNDAWLAVGAPGYPDANGELGRVFVYAWDFDDTVFANGFECGAAVPGCI